MNKYLIILLILFVVVIVFCIGITVLGGGLYWIKQRRAAALSETATSAALLAALEPTLTALPTYPSESSTALPDCTDAQGTPSGACGSPATTPTTAPPSPTAEKTPNVDFNGMSFYLDPRLAQGVLPEIVPAAPGDPSQAMAGEVHPEYTQFTLQGYILRDTFHSPRIYIYPLNDYRTLDSSVDEIASRLTQVLEEQPAQAENLPFLPLWNAGQMFHAQIKYLDFKNGKGVRYLTQYGQAIYPVNNHDLFYTYQAISEDGLWYVAAVLPVSHPLLPASYDGGDPGINDPQSYFAQVSTQLSALDPNSFNPSLLQLDELVSSLKVR